jgi:5-carboxymethyl-2-hydroxymuconate isomerase
MPHLTIEYSANLADRADIAALVRAAHAALMESGLFEAGAPRVRAIPVAHHAIADLDPRNAFADAVLRMGEGRTKTQRKALGEALMAAMGAALKDALAEPYAALSLEIREIGGDMSWKRNSIHNRLRGR